MTVSTTDSAIAVAFDGTDVSPLVTTKFQGRVMANAIRKAALLTLEIPAAGRTAGVFAALLARVLAKNASVRDGASLSNTPAALVTAIDGDDYSDFEGETPAEDYPDSDGGLFIVTLADGDVIVKNGNQSALTFNAFTAADIVPLS